MKANYTPGIEKEPSATYRWIVLFFISMAMFGNYYIYDSISPLADLLKKQLGFSDANIGLLNAIYSLPNIIMVLIGGIIIDRIGTKKASFLLIPESISWNTSITVRGDRCLPWPRGRSPANS